MRALAAAVPLLCIGLPALAQSDSAPRTLDSTVITATRVPITLSEATDSVTVIERAQIERLTAASGVDLFRQVPGLQVDQLGGPGGLSSVYIRGSDSNHVLVLIDGVRVNDPTNSRGGGFDISSIDPSTVERIEVLRGAASAIYGAEAMGGVINITTRRAPDGTPQASVGAGYGGLGYRSLNARVSGGSADTRLSLGASRLLDGRAVDGGQLALSQFDAHARWAPDARVALDLDVRHGERESSAFPDDSGGVRLAEIRTLERKRSHDTSLGARARWEFDTVTLNLAASSYQHAENIDSPGVAPGLRNEMGVPSSLSRTDFKRSNLSASAVWHLSEHADLAVGGEYQREQGGNHTLYTFFGTPIPVDFDLTRGTRSAFAELKWQLTPALLARAGLRHDDVDGNGSHTSPTLGLNYQLKALDASLKASYSEGFKPPSFFALGLPAALGGNPNLRAERSQGGSIGYTQRLWGERASAGVALFKTRYTDLVTFDNASNQTVNARQVDLSGAEFEARLQASERVSVQAHYTRLISHVRDSDEPLRQRPGRRAGVQLAWTPQPNWQFDWRTEYIAQVFDSSIPTGNLMLPTAVRSDVSASWRWPMGAQRALRLSAAIDNLFDRRNEAYVGATSPGRRLRLGLSLSL